MNTLILAAVLVVLIGAAYDLTKRFIADRASARRESKEEATQLLADLALLRGETIALNDRLQARAERNDAALTTFLSSMKELVGEVTKSKISAEQKVIATALRK